MADNFDGSPMMRRPQPQGFRRVTAVVVTVDCYQSDAIIRCGDSRARVASDGAYFVDAIHAAFPELPAGGLVVHALKDAQADLKTLRQRLDRLIADASEDDLFVLFFKEFITDLEISAITILILNIQCQQAR